MAELSSKLKALKFMQRKENAATPSGTASPQASTHEENKAKLSASVRWFLENPEYKTEMKRNFRVTYEQSGGQNRIGHSTFNDFKKKSAGGDENPESEATGKDKEPSTTSPKQQPSSLPKSSSHSVPTPEPSRQPPPKYKQSEERDSGGYKYSKQQQKSSPPSSSNRRNSIESEQSYNHRHSHHPQNPSNSSYQSRHRNGPEEDYISDRRRPYHK
jgi:hypothetical protein